MSNAADYEFMARAMKLAVRGLYSTDPNPRVGCVLVRGGEVVGEGWHARAGEPHAEIHALSAAGARAHGATAYVTLEPCCHHGRTPPCTQALIASGVTRVVAAMVDPNPRVAGLGLGELATAGVEVEHGLMRREAEALNPGFIRRMRDARPYVRVKLGMSLDGRTALANGASQWITGSAARADVHRLRARSSAVLTGIGTVLADDPQFTVRLDDMPDARQPVRVVLDRRLRMPATARMLRAPGATWVVTANDDMQARARLEQAGAQVLHLPVQDLSTVLSYLAQNEVNELLVEAGPTLSGVFLGAGLVDELVLYMAPRLLGHQARGLMVLPEYLDLAQCPALDIMDVRAVGQDWRITARPNNAH